MIPKSEYRFSGKIMLEHLKAALPLAAKRSMMRGKTARINLFNSRGGAAMTKGSRQKSARLVRGVALATAMMIAATMGAASAQG